MINLDLEFDPSNLFTMLSLIKDGAAGQQSTPFDAVPIGINRVLLLGHIAHTDGAAGHILSLFVNVGGNSFAIPMQTSIAVVSGQRNALTQPVILPGGSILQMDSVDAIAGGAVLRGRFLYLDWIVRTQ